MQPLPGSAGQVVYVTESSVITDRAFRDCLDITPQCPTLLFFPKEEETFDVQELAVNLKAVRNVELHIFDGKHGFSDRFSRNYLQASYEKSITLVEAYIRQTQVRQ